MTALKRWVNKHKQKWIIFTQEKSYDRHITADSIWPTIIKYNNHFKMKSKLVLV